MDVYKKLEDSLWAATTAFMEAHGLYKSNNFT